MSKVVRLLILAIILLLSQSSNAQRTTIDTLYVYIKVNDISAVTTFYVEADVTPTTMATQSFPPSDASRVSAYVNGSYTTTWTDTCTYFRLLYDAGIDYRVDGSSFRVIVRANNSSGDTVLVKTNYADINKYYSSAALDTLVGDGVVDDNDYLQIVKDFGKVNVPRSVLSDINADGKVDGKDVYLFFYRYERYRANGW